MRTSADSRGTHPSAVGPREVRSKPLPQSKAFKNPILAELQSECPSRGHYPPAPRKRSRKRKEHDGQGFITKNRRCAHRIYAETRVEGKLEIASSRLSQR